MKPSRGKLPLSITAIVLCIFGFIGVLYKEDTSSLSSVSLLKLSPCSKKDFIDTTHNSESDEDPDDADIDAEETAADTCDVTKGKWVFNISAKPLYSDTTCPYLDKQVSCVQNGRLDSDYRHWEWQPDKCILPRFDPKAALEKLRGKRLMFVGDSLQRGQWQSFVCLVE